MKKAVITGATKGIGKAITHLLANSGYQLAVCARNESSLQELTANLIEEFPNLSVLSGKCDVAVRKDVEQFAEMLNHNGFVPDVLINNAGKFQQQSLMEQSEKDFIQLLDINLMGSYYFCRELVPGMKQRKSGHIINICSVAGISGYADSGGYSTSKHAQLGLSRSLREELKPYNIKVTAVLPGATLTDSWDKTELPSERFMKAEDVAVAVKAALDMSPGAVTEEIVIRPSAGDI